MTLEVGTSHNASYSLMETAPSQERWIHWSQNSQQSALLFTLTFLLHLMHLSAALSVLLFFMHLAKFSNFVGDFCSAFLSCLTGVLSSVMISEASLLAFTRLSCDISNIADRSTITDMMNVDERLCITT